ncbi:MAG: peptidylprolyl isomerase [Ignavibacteriaceae bacterium]|jgi:peptidyl-prolyl cis-trans isomerase SurA
MQKRLLIFSLFSIALLFSACSPKQGEIVLAKYDKGNVTLGEFEKAYAKNSGGVDAAKKDSLEQYQKFLDLYVNFKLKIKDAYERGYDKNPELLAELNDYKKKVGVSYLLDKELVEPALKKLYDQRKIELRVSHIMIRPDSTGDEAARVKANAILKRALAGESFDSLVNEYSADQYSKAKGGDIYYITAGLIVPEFEDAAYKTEVGKVYPEVVKTRFGYHIIKVTEKRERIPSIRVSHILIPFANEAGVNDTLAAFHKIDSIKTALKNGADFAKLAEEYSKDPGSAKKGGDLDFFSRRVMVKEFDEAAFNLKVGEVSDIVKTNYGYHIIKQTDRKPYPSFADEKEELKKIYKQTRYNADYDTLLNFYKNKYNFKLSETGIEKIHAANDSIKVGPDYFDSKLQTNFGKTEVFRLNGEIFNLDTVLNKILTQAEFMNKVITREVLKQAANKIGGDLALELETLSMDSRYPEYADLMEEYKNGIFIFKLQEDEIWNKIKIDDAKLEEHYNKTKEKYNWTDRAAFTEIFSRKDSIIQVCQDLLKQGMDFDSLAAKYTERAGMKSKGGKYEMMDANSSQLAKEAYKLEKVGDVSPSIANANGFSLLRLDQKEAARPKTFEEAKAEVSGSFQEAESKRLENEYVELLRAKYKPEINKEELSKAFKSE